MFIPIDIWFRAFLLTLVIEAPIVALLLRDVEPSRVRRLGLVIFANLASHPVVWFVVSQVFDIGTPAYLVAAEGWAVACEALFYRAALPGLALPRAVGISVVANAASFLVGQVVAALLPGFSL